MVGWTDECDGAGGAKSSGEVSLRPMVSRGVLRIVALIWLLAAWGFIAFLFSSDALDLTTLAHEHVWGGPLLGWALFVLTQVLAPLSGFPVLVALAKLYGMVAASSIFFLAFLVSSVVNFWIARGLAADLVRSTLARSHADPILRMLDKPGNIYIAQSRILGYYAHDLISYTWGLTGVAFWRYYLLGAVAMLAPVVIECVILSQIGVDDVTGVAVFYGATVLISLALAFGWTFLGWRRART